ncbi:lipoprotein-releasing ABC transporter permease subunit [bacterium]|nr:lipoprotein-releasing ABC transporter permease subunit [bacterium]MBU0899924.1 lipoprotein-releasing ABC transporter permease subunit [bacterium]MBU1152698.1 lipoprotein-releasing ABC transporter permease subunit [bacterium]MBU2599485.1 lipoprotein-releasing ABC transporter permease subunit [bacterium]
MKYELLIAFRYVTSKQGKRFVSLITLISILGVIVGVMSLNMVISVMNGFEKDLKEKILSSNAHIFITDIQKKGISNYPLLMRKISNSEEDILGIAPLVEGQAILCSKYQVAGISLLGVNLELEANLTNLKKDIVEGRYEFYPQEKGIIIGKELALALGVSVNEKITLISPKYNNLTNIKGEKDLEPHVEDFVVSGIFASGMYEYDRSRAYISLNKAGEIFGFHQDISTLTIKVSDIYKAEEIANKIRKKIGLSYWVYTWMESNKNLFSALALEKIVMFLILALIVFVAAFNITASLVMTVVDKTKDIGILKALGASQKSIMSIFILKGFIIGLAGTILGTILGITGSHLLSHYQFIKLPSDIYYINYLPIWIQTQDVIYIFFSSVFLCFLATIYPSMNAAKLDPVKALAYE